MGEPTGGDSGLVVNVAMHCLMAARSMDLQPHYLKTSIAEIRVCMNPGQLTPLRLHGEGKEFRLVGNDMMPYIKVRRWRSIDKFLFFVRADLNRQMHVTDKEKEAIRQSEVRQGITRTPRTERNLGSISHLKHEPQSFIRDSA